MIEKVIKLFQRLNPRPNHYTLAMTQDECNMLNKIISNSKIHLEFGQGGSTFEALLKTKAKVYSTESSMDWVKHMKTYLFIRWNMIIGRLKMFPVFVGETKGWGRPCEEGKEHLFPGYSQEVFKNVDTNLIDTIFIDGRFRVACVLSSIIYCKDNEHVKIIVHDFWHRENYSVVLDFLDINDRVDSLGVFTVKKDIDMERVKKEYEKYKIDWR